jgi:hypothetical protein
MALRAEWPNARARAAKSGLDRSVPQERFGKVLSPDANGWCRTTGCWRYGDFDVETAGDGSCQLVSGRQETAVAAKRNHLTIRITINQLHMLLPWNWKAERDGSKAKLAA